MTLLGKVLLGSAIGAGTIFLLATPEQRLRLLGISPKPPKDVEPKRTLPPTPIPQKPDSLIFAALPAGSVVALKGENYITARDSVPARTEVHIPDGSQFVVQDRFPPEGFLVPMWAYIGHLPSNKNFRLPFTEKDILRVLSRPRPL